MNQDEALKLLRGGREGIIEWNRRVAGGDNIPSLHGINLGKSDLGDTELDGASLVDANLTGADLSDATLVGADLSNADLHEADLTDASLFTANLTKANLEDADLSGADLGHANLAGAKLNGAELEDADLGSANLCGADLGYADLEDANLSNANLIGADLSNATIIDTDLSNVNLSGADLSDADLSNACLAAANLRGANLTRATLAETDLSGADLEGSILRGAVLAETNLTKAGLGGCLVHGMSAWEAKLDGAGQLNLAISREGEPIVRVDGFEVARFLDLLTHSEEIREVVDTIQSRLVLILGHFAPERTVILDIIREGLRRHNLRPLSFDSVEPLTPDAIKMVFTLAHLARFAVVDITLPKTILEGVAHIIQDVVIPVKPLLLDGQQDEPVWLGEFRQTQRSLLDTYRYGDAQDLLASFEEHVIVPAEVMAHELRGERVSDF